MTKKNIPTLVIGVAIGFFIAVGYFEEFSPSAPNYFNDEAGHTATSSSLIPTVYLPVKNNAKEDDWTKALSRFMKGESEKHIKTSNSLFGYIDVYTDQYAVEVDYFKKFKEGIGQTLFYEKISNRQPVLALILDKKEISLEEIIYVENLCFENGIKLVLLQRNLKN